MEGRVLSRKPYNVESDCVLALKDILELIKDRVPGEHMGRSFVVSIPGR